MTAGERRAALAASAGALIGQEPRADRLARRLAAATRPGLSIADLDAAPSWLRRSPAERRSLQRRAALASMAPSLARSIDGGWLGRLAKIAGAEALDWAIAQAPRAPDGPMIDADQLDAAGAGVLAAALPSNLAAWLGPRVAVEPAIAAAALQVATS